jgi:sugar/nucleoside kinase (ribokinase family)
MSTIRDFDLLVVGDLNADLILSGDVEPAFGQVEKLIDDATLTLGSSSAIFACGVARLGLRVALVGKVGDDEFGRFIVREMNARGVNTESVVSDPQIKTGLTVILSRGNDRAMLTYSGSIGALRLAEIDHALIARARHLHVASYFLLDALRPDIPTLFDLARASGLTVSLDTNYDPTEKWNGGLAEALRRADVFLPNETELRAIAGVADTEAALDWLASGATCVAVKLGARGAMAQRGNERASAQALLVDVVDTTGAGDTFDAGFIYGYLAGWELARALRLACVCGSLSTRAAGGTTAQPTLAEALEKL